MFRLIGIGLPVLFLGIAGVTYVRHWYQAKSAEDPVWVTTPKGRSGNLPLFWQERTMIAQLAVDAVTMRYRGTLIGWPWLFMRPLLSSVGITFVFSSIVGVKAGGKTPYFLFAVAGQAVWGVLRMGVMMATRSLRRTSSTHKAIPIPPVAAVAAFVAPALLELVIGLGVSLCALVVYRLTDGVWYLHLGIKTLLLPFAVFLLVLIVVAVGQWTAVLSRTYRDLRFVLSSVLSLWSFLTPVMYPATAVPDRLAWTLSWNPAALPVLLSREALFGNSGLTYGIFVKGIIGIAVMSGLGTLARFVDRGAAGRTDILDELEEEEEDDAM
jgi:lipopolysaccharide transport system permease protein